MKQKKLRFSRKLIISLILLIIVASVAIVEAYLHTYMSSLPVVSVPEAFQSAPLQFEGTQVLSYSAYGCSVNWLMFYKIEKPTTPHSNYAFFAFFKTAQNSSILTQTLDIIPVGLKPTSNGTASDAYFSLDAMLFASNYTSIRVQYEFGQIGTYQVDFGLKVKVYARTLLGYLPVDEVVISVGEVLYYGS